MRLAERLDLVGRIPALSRLDGLKGEPAVAPRNRDRCQEIWRDPVRSVRSLGESYRPCVGKEDNRSDGIVETPAAFAGADHQEVA
jgi:hypothetical protein